MWLSNWFCLLKQTLVNSSWGLLLCRGLFCLALRLIYSSRLDLGWEVLFGLLFDDIFFGNCAVLRLLDLVSRAICARYLEGSALLRSYPGGQEVHVALNRRLSGRSASLSPDAILTLPRACRFGRLNLLWWLLWDLDFLHY